MADRPPRDLDWISDDSTGISVPSGAKQAAGWIVEKPARQFFNWLWNRCSRWVHYLSGQSEEWIIIDSANANEKDYDTLAAYIADSPAAGDKVLVKETQVLTAQMIIPGSITIRLLDGVTLTRATLDAASVVKFESDIIIEGVLRLVLSQTGTTAKAIEFDGDNVVGKINVENSSTGTLTTAYHINAAKTGNNVQGFAQNTGAGILVNIVNDNSGENSNLLTVIDESNNVVISKQWATLPSFSVHKNGTNQTGIVSSIFTKITWPTEEFDTNNDFAASIFTPSVAGKYQLSAGCIWNNGVGDMLTITAIYKNGALYKQSRIEMGGTALVVAGPTISIIVDANGTTDFFEVYVFQDSGSNRIIDGTVSATWFNGCRVA